MVDDKVTHESDSAVQRAAGRQDPVGVAEQKIREHGSRYIDFVIPGLLGMNLMGSGIWGIGFAIVDARKRRLQTIGTPTLCLAPSLGAPDNYKDALGEWQSVTWLVPGEPRRWSVLIRGGTA